jgi:hypothetical protein
MHHFTQFTVYNIICWCWNKTLFWALLYSNFNKSKINKWHTTQFWIKWVSILMFSHLICLIGHVNTFIQICVQFFFFFLFWRFLIIVTLWYAPLFFNMHHLIVHNIICWCWNKTLLWALLYSNFNKSKINECRMFSHLIAWRLDHFWET